MHQWNQFHREDERRVSQHLSDSEIVSGLNRGDTSAWSALCDKHGPRLWTFVARLLGKDQHVAADVYQETLLAAARSGRKLDSSDVRLWSWLATIAHRQVALHWRKTLRRPLDPLSTDIEDNAASAASETLAQQEAVQQIRLILAEMPEEQAALLMAKYCENQTVPQIIEHFGGTFEGVRSKLARARRDFRRRYEERTAGTHSES